MPRFDGTGPQNFGPGTGRGFGPCFMGLKSGRRLGRGLGRYFGWNEPQTQEEKKEALTEYRKALEEELEDIKNEEAKLA